MNHLIATFNQVRLQPTRISLNDEQRHKEAANDISSLVARFNDCGLGTNTMKQRNLHRSYIHRRLVPQPAYRVPPGVRRFTVPISDRVQYVSFWFEEGAPYSGFHMASLYEEEISVADPHDAVFLGSSITEIDFRIKWPAYPYAEYHRILQLHGRGHMAMTREQLARYITVSYREFINEHRDTPVEGDVAWAFQPQGDVEFQDLWLLGLRYVTENTYQAEVLYAPRQ